MKSARKSRRSTTSAGDVGEHSSFRPAPYVFICPEIRWAIVESVGKYLQPGDVVFYLSAKSDFAVMADLPFRLERKGRLAVLKELLRRRVQTLEVGEPLWVKYWPFMYCCALVVRLRARLCWYRAPAVVAFAIENMDPDVLLVADRLPLLPKSRLLDALLRWVWRRSSAVLDVIVFGTAASRENYSAAGLADRAGAGSALLFELDPACPCAESRAARPPTVTFVGELSARKGTDLLLAAWPAVLQEVPTARLQIAGAGPMEDLARESSARSPSVSVLGAVARSEVHHLLRETAVVVQPSRRLPTWREQVGLPIVEGLSHGCTIVTTDETGIANFLGATGHHVLPGTYESQDLAAAVIQALQQPLPVGGVLASLPEQAGRYRAGLHMRTRVQQEGHLHG